LGPLPLFGIRWVRLRRLRQADLKVGKERQRKQQDQPEIGHGDDQLAAMRHLHARQPERETARFFDAGWRFKCAHDRSLYRQDYATVRIPAEAHFVAPGWLSLAIPVFVL